MSYSWFCLIQIVIDKSSIGFDLLELEEAAYLVLEEAEKSGTSENVDATSIEDVTADKISESFQELQLNDNILSAPSVPKIEELT